MARDVLSALVAQTALLDGVGLGACPFDLRVQHNNVFVAFLEYDNTLEHSYHIRRHAYAFFSVGGYGLYHVLRRWKVAAVSRRGSLAEQELILYYRTYHIMSTFP